MDADRAAIGADLDTTPRSTDGWGSVSAEAGVRSTGGAQATSLGRWSSGRCRGDGVHASSRAAQHRLWRPARCSGRPRRRWQRRPRAESRLETRTRTSARKRMTESRVRVPRRTMAGGGRSWMAKEASRLPFSDVFVRPPSGPAVSPPVPFFSQQLVSTLSQNSPHISVPPPACCPLPAACQCPAVRAYTAWSHTSPPTAHAFNQRVPITPSACSTPAPPGFDPSALQPPPPPPRSRSLYM
ncbi:hypothetical protein BD413DRAFT_571361 [Trametes elegans]|nr:hypothetical protein BD413DRAFT_571361 [Trametes elegans]